MIVLLPVLRPRGAAGIVELLLSQRHEELRVKSVERHGYAADTDAFLVTVIAPVGFLERLIGVPEFSGIDSSGQRFQITKNMVLSLFGLIETHRCPPRKVGMVRVLGSFDFDVLELIREHCAHCGFRGCLDQRRCLAVYLG